MAKLRQKDVVFRPKIPVDLIEPLEALKTLMGHGTMTDTVTFLIRTGLPRATQEAEKLRTNLDKP